MLDLDWMESVKARLKRKNQVLFSPKDDLLAPLALLLEGQDRRAVVLWAFALVEETVERLEQKYPGEDRSRTTLELCRLWAAGTVKMPQAKAAILACHALAREWDSPEDIALCHAVGQGCSVVHTAGHAMGYPIYELTALVCALGPDRCRAAVDTRAQIYLDRLLYWQDHWRDWPVLEAAILRHGGVPVPLGGVIWQGQAWLGRPQGQHGPPARSDKGGLPVQKFIAHP